MKLIKTKLYRARLSKMIFIEPLLLWKFLSRINLTKQSTTDSLFINRYER